MFSNPFGEEHGDRAEVKIAAVRIRGFSDVFVGLITVPGVCRHSFEVVLTNDPNMRRLVWSIRFALTESFGWSRY